MRLLNNVYETDTGFTTFEFLGGFVHLSFSADSVFAWSNEDRIVLDALANWRDDMQISVREHILGMLERNDVEIDVIN